MNTTNAVATLESVLHNQLMIAGGEPAVEAAVTAVLNAAEPAVQGIAIDLAQQAAAEVDAQLPDHDVEVVLSDGDPTIRVRPTDGYPDVASGDYEARLTLRLPDQLKDLVEDAAGQAGDSVNTWVVKALSKGARKRESRGGRVTGSFEL